MKQLKKRLRDEMPPDTWLKLAGLTSYLIFLYAIMDEATREAFPGSHPDQRFFARALVSWLVIALAELFLIVKWRIKRARCKKSEED